MRSSSAPGSEIPPEIPIAYRHLADLLPSSFLCCFDRQLRVVFASGSLQDKFAYTAEEAIGRSGKDVLPHAAWNAAEPRLLAALVGESSKFALILPTGAVLQLLVAPVAECPAPEESREAQVIMLGVESPGGAQAGGSAGTGPISDSERLAAVVQATGVGLWEWDMFAQQVHFSTEWKRQLGYADDEIGDDFDEWVRRLHSEDRERVMQAVADYLAKPGSVYRQTFRLRHKDGSYRSILAQGAVYHDAAGRPAHMFGSHTDITQAVAREAALRDKAEQLAQVMLSAPEGILLLDNLNYVLLANKRAEANLSRLATYDADQRLLQLGGVDLDKLLTTPPEGQWHTLQANQHIYELIARPVESGPVPAGWVMIMRDATAERAVREQLQRQERLAAVGQLAAGIAHDFNNIMSVISIYAEMTSEAPGLTAKERARTLTIVEQTQRATRMIRQILDFSRQSVFERQALDLLPLLKEQEKLLKQTLPESIEVSLAAVRGEYFVWADPTRLQQLVMNLAVNARDAMPEGGQLRMELTMLAVEDARHSPVPGLGAGTWVRMDVQDTGTGIRPEHMAHVFEPFFTTKERGKGTGLGLAQAHGIVAQHDGYITVSSELGVGSRFSIFLPAQPVADDTAGAAMLRPDLPLGQGELVLLVEDDATLRSSLAELMTLWNYQVVTAANGEEALALLADESRQQDEPLALIVSDVVMPRLGGVALVKTLRRRGVTTPVILMSGHPIGEEQVFWQDLGVETLLAKPPNSRQLAEAMAQVLRRST